MYFCDVGRNVSLIVVLDGNRGVTVHMLSIDFYPGHIASKVVLLYTVLLITTALANYYA